MRMRLNIKAPNAEFGPKWAWIWALWFVPDAVKLPINVWFLSALTTLHPKGLDVTVRELLEGQLNAQIEHFKVTRETSNGSESYEEHNNLSHCNAAGCDGVQCEPTEHLKGDF